MSSAPVVLALALLAAAASPLPTEEAAAAVSPPHGMPVIESIWISTRDPHAGQTVSGRVATSNNVGYVEARIDYRNVPLHRDGPGKFSLNYTVPWWLPPWLRHKWTLQIIARSVDGVEAKEALPITVH